MSQKTTRVDQKKVVTSELKPLPSFDEKAIKTVEDVLCSGKVNYWTGKKGIEFEKRFAEWQGSKYAIAVYIRAAPYSIDDNQKNCRHYSTNLHFIKSSQCSIQLLSWGIGECGAEMH